MIAFRINGEELDLNPNTTVQVEYYNALFETDRIPAVYTMPLTLPWSKKNKRLLGFPGQLSVRRYRKEPFECEMYLNNLWRVGKLYIKGTQEKGISINFQSDVGDLGNAFKNDSLRELDLGTEPLVKAVHDIYPASNYALFPVYNPSFYDNDESYSTYSGYLNNYETGFSSPCTPFPYLVYILRQVMAQYGYKVTGDWLEAEETRRLVIYNQHAAEQVQFNKHMPDMKVNDFMKAIRAAFGLGFNFNTTTKTIEIVRLKDVILNTSYVDWRQHNLKVVEWIPNETDGFLLKLTPDPDDELNKSLPSSAVHQVGRGKEIVPICMGTLHMLRGSKRLVPQARQEGSSSTYAGSNDFSFSLLSYRGMQPDADGNLYPLGTSNTQNFAGTEIGRQSLEWPGSVGLYEQCHRHWLEFLSETESIETEINLNITNLRTLRQDLKVLVQTEHSTVKALWSKISVSVSLKEGIQTAKATLLKVRI